MPPSHASSQAVGRLPLNSGSVESSEPHVSRERRCHDARPAVTRKQWKSEAVAPSLLVAESSGGLSKRLENYAAMVALYRALSQYHKLKEDTRRFVKDTRWLERSNPGEAIARYRRAIDILGELAQLARAARLGDDFVFAQTDALPLERIVMCLVKGGDATAAADQIAQFVQRFPHARDMTLVSAATERVNRVSKRSV